MCSASVHMSYTLSAQAYPNNILDIIFSYGTFVLECYVKAHFRLKMDDKKIALFLSDRVYNNSDEDDWDICETCDEPHQGILGPSFDELFSKVPSYMVDELQHAKRISRRASIIQFCIQCEASQTIHKSNMCHSCIAKRDQVQRICGCWHKTCSKCLGIKVNTCTFRKTPFKMGLIVHQPAVKGWSTARIYLVEADGAWDFPTIELGEYGDTYSRGAARMIEELGGFLWGMDFFYYQGVYFHEQCQSETQFKKRFLSIEGLSDKTLGPYVTGWLQNLSNCFGIKHKNLKDGL